MAQSVFEKILLNELF